LNSEQFALAMHFVHKKIGTGLDPPTELTAEMIPPSFRPKQQTEVIYYFCFVLNIFIFNIV
jgi:hypothetical protein